MGIDSSSISKRTKKKKSKQKQNKKIDKSEQTKSFRHQEHSGFAKLLINQTRSVPKPSDEEEKKKFKKKRKKKKKKEKKVKHSILLHCSSQRDFHRPGTAKLTGLRSKNCPPSRARKQKKRKHAQISSTKAFSRCEYLL
jgi:hypothetical protein